MSEYFTQKSYSKVYSKVSYPKVTQKKLVTLVTQFLLYFLFPISSGG